MEVASGCVGDIHSVTEQLGDQFCVRSLTTACACAGELKERLLELAALNGCLFEFIDHVLLDVRASGRN